MYDVWEMYVLHVMEYNQYVAISDQFQLGDLVQVWGFKCRTEYPYARACLSLRGDTSEWDIETSIVRGMIKKTLLAINIKGKIWWKGTFINYLLLLSDRLRLSRDRERRTDGERRRMEGERRGEPDRPRENERRRGLRLRDLPIQSQSIHDAKSQSGHFTVTRMYKKIPLHTKMTKIGFWTSLFTNTPQFCCYVFVL